MNATTDRTGLSAWSRARPPRVQAAVGAAFLLCAGWLLWTFPVGRPWLLGFAVLLAIAQWRNQRTWLVALPVMIGTIDLGAWSGRFLVSEQDALLAVLMGTALISGQYQGGGRQLIRPSFAPLWLVAIAVAIGLIRGLQAPHELDANAWNGYLTSWNAVRIAKGPLWGLLLWPLLAHQLDKNRPATEQAFAIGIAGALVGLGLLVLWERGLAADVVRADSVWGLFATWMDLSGSYRITGPFSQMHLGGEAIDAFLVLAWPFAALLLLQARRPLLILLGVLALGLTAYGVLVTFTRTTYAASAVGLLAFGLASFNAIPGAYRLRLASAVLYAGLAAVVFIHGYRLGGTLTMAGFLLIVLAATSTAMATRRPAAVTASAILLLVLVAGVALSVHGMTSSKWNDVDARTAIATSVGSGLLLALGGVAAGRALRPFAWTRTGIAIIASLAVLLPLVTLGFSGAQMEQRFALVQRDLDTRMRHWNEVLAVLPDGLPTAVFGAGLGRFPRTFLLAGDEPPATWHFGHENSGHFLRLLGTGNLCYGQRLPRLERGVYRVEIGLRNPSVQSGNLAVKLQPRRLLESERWQPATTQISVVVDPHGSDWTHIAQELRVNGDSSPPWYDPRFPVLALANQGDPRSAVDVAYVRLVDATGRNRLVNGDFGAGGDRWIAYNDFQHLEWHAKNFYIALLFDMGAAGLAAFGGACLFGVVASWRKATHSLWLGAASLAAVVGLIALGATGTLLDVPQIMTLLVIVLAVALWRPAPSQTAEICSNEVRVPAQRAYFPWHCL